MSGTERGLAERLGIYLQSMFPPALMIPAGLATFGAVHGTLQLLAGVTPLRFGPRALAGAASVVLFMLLMRVYDELKDVEQDRRLGQAGDPRYKDRPIVTGATRVEDVRLLRWVVTALLLALNAPLGWPWPGVAFLAAFSVMWLSFRWFFWPRIQTNLLLAFATHNPLTGVVALYVVAVFAGEHGWAKVDPTATALLVLGQWLPVAAWETSRKVRVPEDETAYQTYSMLLGWKVAALVPAAFVLGSTACMLLVARRAGLGWGYPAALLLAAAVTVGACLRFRLAPTRARAKLQPFADQFCLVCALGLLIAVCVHAGVGVGASS